jgi:hypothetical protein
MVYFTAFRRNTRLTTSITTIATTPMITQSNHELFAGPVVVGVDVITFVAVEVGVVVARAAKTANVEKWSTDAVIV